jgi:hypothetical protein
VRPQMTGTTGPYAWRPNGEQRLFCFLFVVGYGMGRWGVSEGKKVGSAEGV